MLAVMDLTLQDKVAVVTGAGAGIGLAATRALVAEGAQVVAGSRTTDSLDELAGVTPVAIDLMAPDAPGQLVTQAVDEHGRVDLLVNNLGAAQMRLDGFLATTDEDFKWAFEINFF